MLTNLRVDSTTDERTDPAKSTVAATRYLEDLFSRFGDWRLALAGYNAGEARVEQAIHRSGAHEFEILSGLLPLETRRYVPAVMLGSRQEATNPSRPARVFALFVP